MADSRVLITEGTDTSIDTRTEQNGQHRQVIVVGDQSVTEALADVKHSDPNSDDGGLVVRDPNTTAIVSGLRDVRIQSLVDGTVTVEDITRVKNVVDGTLSNVYRVHNLVDGTLSTVGRVQNVVDGTLSTVGRVSNLVDGTLTTVTNITNSVAVHIGSTGGTLAVFSQQLGTAAVSAKDGTFAVYFSPASPAVNVAQFGGNNAVTPNAGIPAVNVYSTTSIFTVSGSTSGGTTSGVTLVSPSANYNFKVFAVKLTTTAQVGNVWRLVNGAGAGQSEFWRAALQAPAQGIAGITEQVTPPGYLFATGVSTTLALHSDAGSLVHYSVSYIKESS